MDNELFELCKEVHEKTEWRPIYSDVRKFRWDGTLADHEILYNHDHIPLYTSDYLLDKLLPFTFIQFFARTSGEIGIMWSPKKPMYQEIMSDTPLKCLLKLTIALHEAKELV